MAGKYNTQHHRSLSNYPQRLRDRGLSRAPEMLDLDTLRKRQKAEEAKFDYAKPIERKKSNQSRFKPRTWGGLEDRRKRP